MWLLFDIMGDKNSTRYTDCFAGKDFSAAWIDPHIENLSKILEPFHNSIRDVLEIGSWEGRSAILWLNLFPNSRITCVDTFIGSLTSPSFPQWRAELEHCERRFDSNLAEYRDRVRKIKTRSAQALDRLFESGETFDLIYVDGEHRRDDVLIDSLISFRLLRTGGILIWDDYYWRPEFLPEDRPAPAIDLFLTLHADALIELHRGNQIFVRKVTKAVGK